MKQTDFEFVIAIEYYPNCPVHDGGVFIGMQKLLFEEDILDYALENLNKYHIIDAISILTNDEIELEYEQEVHRYCGIKYIKNDKIIKRTIDNGSGELIWVKVNETRKVT